MLRRATTAFAAAVLLVLPAVAHADLAAYSQNFEGLVQSSPTALSGDGWIVYGNVFSPDHSTYYWGYGPYPAPNGGAAFCGIDVGQGGTAQGAQQMVVYNDYNNGEHANGNLVEANVYHEQTVGAADVGTTWVFLFDAKRGNIAGATTAVGFIKTLNPAAGWAMTHYLTADMTAIPAEWGTFSLTLPIDASLVGQVLQFGFSSTATHYEGSGIFYDNVRFDLQGAVPTQQNTWGALKARYR